MFRTDDLFEVADFKEMQHVVALLDATTQAWMGVTVQDMKGYEDMCPFKEKDRNEFCNSDCPYFCDCDLHNAEWKKNKLVEQLEFYKQLDFNEEVANVEEMLASLQ